MTVATGTKPHPIFLAGRWVESPDVLEVTNPADASTPAGATFNATEAQYEEAVEAAVDAFDTTRRLPAYERGRILRDISAGIRARREELGRWRRAVGRDDEEIRSAIAGRARVDESRPVR